MEITCLQMDVLISFYLDGDLSDTLKRKVEEHLQECPACKTKFNILSSLFKDMRSVRNTCVHEESYSTNIHPSKQYQYFKDNLSSYLDNELPEEDSVKMRKYTIYNKKARKELEDAYNIRKLMHDSFRKTASETKSDFTKDIIKHVSEDDKNLEFNPLISVGFAFVLSILLISAVIIYVLSM